MLAKPTDFARSKDLTYNGMLHLAIQSPDFMQDSQILAPINRRRDKFTIVDAFTVPAFSAVGIVLPPTMIMLYWQTGCVNCRVSGEYNSFQGA